MKAQGAVTRMDVVPVVVDKFGISARVNPAIQVAATRAVLEAIKTNSLPYATGHFRGGDESEPGGEAEMTRGGEGQEEGQDTDGDGDGGAMEPPGAAARVGRRLGSSSGSHFLEIDAKDD